jgi:O-antigen/teichoic acid export membrane protein
MKDLNKILKAGLLWSAIQVLFRRIFDFIVKLVLLNVLFPEDFGLVTMTVVFTSIIQVIADLGMKNALIQRKKAQLFDLHFQSVFWFGLVWASLIFTLVYFFGNPLISNFFEEPRTVKILPVLTIPIIIEAITLVHRVKILRVLNFKKMALIQTSSVVIAGLISITMALNSFGVWSLVFYISLPYLIQLPLFLILVKWLPKFTFSIRYLQEIFKISGYIFITTLLIVLTGNLDNLFIGKIMGAKILGIYSLAFMFTILLSSQITSMMDRVLFPFYSRVQDDIALVKRYYLNSLLYYAIVLYPVMLLMLFFCSPILDFFFDSKWSTAAPVIRILAFVVPVQLFTHKSTLVYRSLGKPRLETFIYLLTLLFVMLPAVYLGSFYGVEGISLGIFAAACINLFVSLYFLNRELSITFKDILVKLKAPLIGFFMTILIMSPIYLFVEAHIFVQLLVLILIYGSVIYYFHGEKIKNLIRKILLLK